MKQVTVGGPSGKGFRPGQKLPLNDSKKQPAKRLLYPGTAVIQTDNFPD